MVAWKTLFSILEVSLNFFHEPKRGAAFQHCQRPLAWFPFIAPLLRDHDSLTAQVPTTPALRMKP